ncbi:MAG: efflux RND transporter periplasmic adaptor subunit [Chthonomonadales bacterium]
MKRRFVLGCTAALAMAGAGIWYAVHALMSTPPPLQHFETVDRGNVEIEVTETGSIEPLKKIDVKSKVAGRIAQLYVDEGSVVRPGQVLAKIDPTEINSQVAQIKAQLDGARARYEQAVRAASWQVNQTDAAIKEARENLRTAQERLEVAREQSRTQPGLTRSAVAQAEASLKAAQDRLNLLKTSTHPQALVQAQSGYEEAKAAELAARRNLQRQERLLERGFVSQQAVDAAQADLASAKARLDQAKAKLDLIGQQNRMELAEAESQVNQQAAALQTARENLAQVSIYAHEAAAAEAAVRQAQASLQAALAGRKQDRMKLDDVMQAQAVVSQLENQLRQVQVQQSDTTIIAPMAGVVTRRYVEKGELVMSGVSSFSSGTPIVQVADLQQMLVKISINEVDVHKVRPGLPVEITIDGVRGVLFRGHVTRVAPSAEGSGALAQQNPAQQGGVVRFAVEVAVDRPDERLKPGMSARCAIVVARRKNVLRLPTDGVAGDGSDASVTLVTTVPNNGRPREVFTQRKIVAGLRGDSFVEIVKGLKEGDRVKPLPYTGPKRRQIDLDMK